MPTLPQGHHLYLYCVNLDYFPSDYDDFISNCQRHGLLAEASANLGPNHYLIGDNFLQYVSFLGCSPYLKVYPEHADDTDYCSAYIPDKTQAVRFLANKQVTAPRCPTCKRSIQPEYNLVEAWQKDKNNSAIQCQYCNTTSTLYELDWRKNAGFFNFAIAISNIFPKEAIPSQDLLDWLQDISGYEWRYFYA